MPLTQTRLRYILMTVALLVAPGSLRAEDQNSVFISGPVLIQLQHPNGSETQVQITPVRSQFEFTYTTVHGNQIKNVKRTVGSVEIAELRRIWGESTIDPSTWVSDLSCSQSDAWTVTAHKQTRTVCNDSKLIARLAKLRSAIQSMMAGS